MMSTGVNELKRLLIGVLSISGVFVLSFSANAQNGKQLAVFVSIPPQKYFVQQIGKGRVNIQVMVQPGASPAIYEPRPRQMAAISSMGNSTPVSLFAHMMDTMAVSGRMAACKSQRSIAPSRSTGRWVTS